MVEQNEPPIDVTENIQLSKQYCLENRPFEKTRRTLLLHQVFIVF